jgi:hypothetical protein
MGALCLVQAGQKTEQGAGERGQIFARLVGPHGQAPGCVRVGVAVGIDGDGVRRVGDLVAQPLDRVLGQWHSAKGL